jgi:MFS transporter, DHA1 family, multidrug resistance protein B
MRFSGFHTNVKLRIVMNFVTNLLSNMFTPFMSVYFATTLGTTISGVATILSMVITLLFSALGGHYADRIGRKKVMILSEGVCAISYIILALSNSPWIHSALITLLMTMMISAGWGISRPAVDAMLIDVTTTETRKSMYRITYWSNNLSISVAGMIGAYFFSDYLFELFITCAAISLLSLLVTKKYIVETRPTGVNKKEEPSLQRKTSILGSYKLVLLDGKFMLYIVATILTLSVERNLTNYIGIRLEDQMHGVKWMPWLHTHVSGLEMLGILRTENTLLIVLLPLVLGKLLFSRSSARTMLIAMVFNFIGYSYLSFGNQPSLLILFMLVAAIGELIYVPIKQALLVNLVPDHSRSSYMAVNNMASRASFILAGLNVIIGGFLSPGSMALLIFLTGILGLVLLLISISPSLETRNMQFEGSKTMH